jgi:hypothetical protein
MLGLEGSENYDLSRHFGTFIGYGLRHVGYIRQVPDSALRFKYRTWDLGLSAGFKIGRMQQGLFFAGYTVEWPFNYKEKKFVDGQKEDKFNEWLSQRTPTFSHALFFGYQARSPWKAMLKVMFYLNQFHNTSFSEEIDGVVVRPYQTFNEQLVSVSLQQNLFHNWRNRSGSTTPKK